MHTNEDIEKLKRDWLRDPCWDIEDTEGFEDHKDELVKYRLECEESWRAKKMAEFTKQVTAMGLNDNLPLAEVIIQLTNRINWLEKRVIELEQVEYFRPKGRQ